MAQSSTQPLLRQISDRKHNGRPLVVVFGAKAAFCLIIVAPIPRRV